MSTFTLGQQVRGTYKQFKENENFQTTTSYTGTITHVAKEGLYIVLDSATGLEILVEFSEGDTMCDNSGENGRTHQ